MSRLFKLLNKCRQNPKNVRFHELETVLKRLGFARVKTHSGSHFKWKHAQRPLWYSAPRQNPVKSIYIKGLINLVDHYLSDYL